MSCCSRVGGGCCALDFFLCGESMKKSTALPCFLLCRRAHLADVIHRFILMGFDLFCRILLAGAPSPCMGGLLGEMMPGAVFSVVFSGAVVTGVVVSVWVSCVAVGSLSESWSLGIAVFCWSGVVGGPVAFVALCPVSAFSSPACFACATASRASSSVFCFRRRLLRLLLKCASVYLRLRCLLPSCSCAPFLPGALAAAAILPYTSPTAVVL